MSFDGVFIHHFLLENKNYLINERINKIYFLDKSSFILSLSKKRDLFVSLNENAHLRFTKMDFLPTTKISPLFTLLKKYLESSIITDVNQYHNDRILIFDINSFSDLGFIKKIKMIIEFFGKNCNLILTDELDVIIDCYKKSLDLTEEKNRVMVPKAKYSFPTSEQLNPYFEKSLASSNIYQGVSLLLYTEMNFQNNLNIINNQTEPVLMKAKNKIFFYCFPLYHLQGEIIPFNNLSELLETYYVTLKHQSTNNSDQKQIENYLKKENTKAINKMHKQELEKIDAYKNLSLEVTGNLLSSNLFKVKKNDKEITVENYYDQNKLVTITLNPLLSPTENLEAIFKQYKKSKRSISVIEEQIEATKNEISYLETLEEQLKLSKVSELKEILEELGLVKSQVKSKKVQKPQITTYKDSNGNLIMVGKNNIQNNYLTHTLANKNDYFFHVKGVPGSHTILRCSELTSDLIYLAGMIAAYYSKSKNSSQVPVDYTLVKNVKKVPKTKGSFVTYTNYKTVFVTPDLEYIQNLTSTYK